MGVERGTQLQRSVFKWVTAQDEERARDGKIEKPKAHAQITAKEVARDYGVPEEELIKHLTGEIEEANSCCFALPFTLMMVTSYTFVCYGHDPVVPVNAVEDSITFDIEENANFAFSSPFIGHKTIYDVNSRTDFWSWMIQGFMPLIFVQEKGWAEGRDVEAMTTDYFAKQNNDTDQSLAFPRGDRGFVLHYNRIVGGVRLRQEAADESGCETLDTLRGFYERQCVGGLKYELYPEMWIARTTTNPTREWWMWAHDSQEILRDLLQKRELEGWLDDRTMKIEISIPVYNGQFGVHSIIFVDFFFSRGGHIWKRLIPMSTYSQWFHGAANIIPDTLWVLGLGWIIGSELYKMNQVFSVGGCKGVREDYLSFWNVSDWTAVGCGFWIIVGLAFRWRNTQKINNTLEALGQIDEVNAKEQYHAQAQKYMTELEDEVMNAHVFRILLGLYPILIIVRLFKAFSAQPRLSLVTRTLGSAAIDLFHFMLVFISIFMTYAIAGVVLFGREVDGFTNLQRATNTCFRCMMGDFDWEELQRVGRIEAGIWFVSFMVIIVLIMLNMLMAIVMDAYSQEKDKIGEAETLWQEVQQARERWKGQVEGRLVSLKEALRAVRSNSGEFERFVRKKNSSIDLPTTAKSGIIRSTTSQSQLETTERFYALVTVSSLQDACPRMREEQASQLIEDAVLDYYNANKENGNTEEMLRIIRKINYSTKQLKKYMKQSLANNYDDHEKKPESVDKITDEEAEEGAEEGGEDEPKVAQTSEEPVTVQQLSFTEELNLCRHELKKAKEWIGEEEMDATLSLPQIEHDTSAVTAACIETYRNTVKKRMKQLEHQPLMRLDEARDFSVKRILDDEDAVLAACRQSDIEERNDPQRIQALGQCVRVMERDPGDNSVRCRVPGVGDVWFGVGALANARPQPGAEPLLASNEREEYERQQLEGEKRSSVAATSNEEVLKRITDIQGEISTGRQVVGEALKAVSEIELRVVREREDKAKIAAKFQLLKKKVVQLTRENRRLQEEEKKQEERLGIVGTSRDEYHDLVSTLLEENKRLKRKLVDTSDQHMLALADLSADGGIGYAQLQHRVENLAQVMDRPGQNGHALRKRPGGNGSDRSFDGGKPNGHGNYGISQEANNEIRLFREEVRGIARRNASPNGSNRDAGSQQGRMMGRGGR